MFSPSLSFSPPVISRDAAHYRALSYSNRIADRIADQYRFRVAIKTLDAQRIFSTCCIAKKIPPMLSLVDPALIVSLSPFSRQRLVSIPRQTWQNEFLQSNTISVRAPLKVEVLISKRMGCSYFYSTNIESNVCA